MISIECVLVATFGVIFFITGKVGRNYVFLRSILAWSIALFFWWNNRSSDFDHVRSGKTENSCREKSEDKLIQTGLGSLKKTTRGLTKEVRVMTATGTFLYASNRSKVIFKRYYAC